MHICPQAYVAVSGTVLSSVFVICIFIFLHSTLRNLTNITFLIFRFLTICPTLLLFCNISGLAAGMAIGIVGDAGVRAVGQQERLFVGMILILIFAEALGLYGLIVALILSQQSYQCTAAVVA